MTPAKMGRSMKKRDRFILASACASGSLPGPDVFFAGVGATPAGDRRQDESRCTPSTMTRSPRGNLSGRRACRRVRAQHDLPVSDLVFRGDDEDRIILDWSKLIDRSGTSD